jgi:hypothetical protein
MFIHPATTYEEDLKNRVGLAEKEILLRRGYKPVTEVMRDKKVRKRLSGIQSPCWEDSMPKES